MLEIGKPKYVNSTSSPTSIDSLFFLPGLFYRLIIEIASVNQRCSIEYSSISSPFYHCLFKNLIPAQWFVLTYSLTNNDDQSSTGDVTIVYTGRKQRIFKRNIN